MAKDRPAGGSAPREDPPRRPYRAPRVVDYGSIPARTLTTAAGSQVDSMAMLKVM
jgi:hypothetical protein